MKITLNGENRTVDGPCSLAELAESECEETMENVAIAVEDEVIPRSEWDTVTVSDGDVIEIIRPIQGGSTDSLRHNTEELEIADRQFDSRLILGTGGYTNLEKMRNAIEASQTEMVTVGLRRVNVEQTGETGLMNIIDELDLHVLPNTAGCYTADDAVKTAKLGRDALNTDWVKLEVIGDDKTLYPDTEELLDAARRLIADDFVVLPYTSDDPITAKKLESIGCPAVMPLGSPIGSGRGIANPDNLKIIREEVDVPIILDAGIGSATDAVQAMELGLDAILTSSAIAKAEAPAVMATSLRHAVMAGRLSYEAGRIPKKLYGKASTTMEGRIHE